MTPSSDHPIWISTRSPSPTRGRAGVSQATPKTYLPSVDVASSTRDADDARERSRTLSPTRFRRRTIDITRASPPTVAKHHRSRISPRARTDPSRAPRGRARRARAIEREHKTYLDLLRLEGGDPGDERRSEERGHCYDVVCWNAVADAGRGDLRPRPSPGCPTVCMPIQHTLSPRTPCVYTSPLSPDASYSRVQDA